MHPLAEQLNHIPLTPTHLFGNVPMNATSDWLSRNFTAFTDTTLTQVVRQWIALILRAPQGAKGAVLIMFAGYSLRVGDAVALHNAGADGMATAALGQWKSGVYQLYIRTARHKAMSWTVRMGRGHAAKLWYGLTFGLAFCPLRRRL
jgi:hypothetical protein